MNQEELSLSFINDINNNDFSKINRYFTKESSSYLINENKELSYNEMIDILTKLSKPLEVVRTLKSHVCIKYETKNLDYKVNLYFDIQNRRIKRLELEII